VVGMDGEEVLGTQGEDGRDGGGTVSRCM